MNFLSTRKRALAVLFLIFLSSCSQNCPQWHREDICSPCPQYASNRLYIAPRGLCNLIDLELVSDQTDMRLYLNILSVAVPESDRYPGEAVVTITIDGLETEVMAARFEGGQRFLLSRDGRDLIIEALQAGQPVTVSISRYKQTFPATNFNQLH